MRRVLVRAGLVVAVFAVVVLVVWVAVVVFFSTECGRARTAIQATSSVVRGGAF